MCSKEIDKLLEIYNPENYREKDNAADLNRKINFLNRIFPDPNMNNISDFIKIDKAAFLLAPILIYDLESMDFVDDIYKGLIPINDPSKLEQLCIVVRNAIALKNTPFFNKFAELEETLNKSPNEEIASQFERFLIAQLDSNRSISPKVTTNLQSLKNVLRIIYKPQSYGEEFFIEALDFLIKNGKDNLQVFFELLDCLVNRDTLKEKYSFTDKQANKPTMDLLRESSFFKYLMCLKQYKEKLEQERKEIDTLKSNELRRRTKIYKILSEFKRIGKLNDTDIDKLYNLADDTQERQIIMLAIIKAFNKEYFSLRGKYLEQQNASDIEKALKNHQIDINSISSEDLEKLKTRGNPTDIKRILVFLDEPIFSFLKNDLLINILLNSKPPFFIRIKNIINLYVLDGQFLSDYPLLFTDEILLNNLETNLKLLKGQNIDLSRFAKKHFNVLLSDSNDLKRKLLILKKYGISYDQNCRVFYLLTCDSVDDSLDLLVESGYYSYFMDNVHAIKDDTRNIALKIRLADSLAIPVINADTHKLSESIRNDNFSFGSITIDNSELDQYVENSSSLFMNVDILEALSKTKNDVLTAEDIEFLKKYLIDPYTLEINGVKISYNKVKKYYAAIKDKFMDMDEDVLLFNCIIMNSILSEEQINQIASEILKSRKNKKEKKPAKFEV